MEDKKIKDALMKNTQWSGSPEKMWQGIVQELKPSVPWWRKPMQIWLTPVAAAIILLVFLFNTSIPKHPDSNLVPEPAPQNPIMFRTLLTEWQLAEIVLELPDQIDLEANITLNVKLLPLVEELKISAKPPIIRLMSNGGEPNIIAETKIDSWVNQSLMANQALITQVPIMAPSTSGEYLIEIEIEAIQDDEIIYLKQQQVLQVK